MGGGILLVQYHSLFQLLSNIYSDFKWNKQLFSSFSKDIWTDDYLANYFVQWLKKQSNKDVSQVHEIVMKKSNNASSPLKEFLATAFPEYKWSSKSQSGKKAQYMLKTCLENLFTSKDTVLLEEYRHPDVSNLELDFFFPQYKLAFEYQVKKSKSQSLIKKSGTTTL